MLTFETITLTQDDFTLRADMQIQAGVTAVIGPSGGGKSTFLSTIAGFITPDEGQILWDGSNLIGTPPMHRPVSMLFQDNNLFPHLTVAQNIGLGIKPNLRLSQEQSQQVRDTLAQVGLQGMQDRKPAALSGGQQSRAALARVLVSLRPLVLLDEPFAALGPALKTDMLTLVRDTLLTAGKTIIMVTHDPEDAKQIADHVVFVAEGVVHAPTPTADIFAAPPDALRAYLR